MKDPIKTLVTAYACAMDAQDAEVLDLILAMAVCLPRLHEALQAYEAEEASGIPE